MTAAHGALYVFYSIHLVAQGYGKTIVGLLWTLGVVAEIVVFLLMPSNFYRVSMRKILLACFALAALRFLLMGWTAEFVGLLVFAQLLHGASFGAHHATTMAALNRWFVAGQQSRAQALLTAVLLMEQAVWEAPCWPAPCGKRVGPGITFSAASLLALIGLILVWRGVHGRFGKAAVR